VVLVLRPHLFLPDNKPILINTERALRACGGPLPPASAPTSWVPHYIQEGNPFLVDNSGNKLLTLPFTTNRTADNTLSIFCLLINAYYKLTSLPSFPQSPPEVDDYLAELIHLFPLIFFVPPAYLPGPFPSGSEPPLPTSLHAQWPVQSGDSMDLDSHDSNPNHLGIDSNFDSVGGGQYMDDCEEDSEADDSESGSEDEDAETERRHRAITRAFDGSGSQRVPLIMESLGMSCKFSESSYLLYISKLIFFYQHQSTTQFPLSSRVRRAIELLTYFAVQNSIFCACCSV
jgi:hypothetical protein